MILILNVLPERPQDPVYIRLAESSFGCKPNANGRAVYATCLADGEKCRWNRSDFMGIIRDECMPIWAHEQLAAMTQTRDIEPSMDDIT